MNSYDLFRFLLLPAVWGGSYLFIRIGAGEFGSVPLGGMRALLATLMLVPLVLARGAGRDLVRHWKPIALVALANCGIPYVLFAAAEHHISAGMASILGSTTPLFNALIAWLWLNERLTPPRVFGLLLGFTGVWLLMSGRIGGAQGTDASDVLWAGAACIASTAMYGFATNYNKRHLAGVKPLSVAFGCQFFSALVLAVPTLYTWPQAMPSAGAWGSVLALSALCTALAYVLFFGLLADIGPAAATPCLFLIPVFGVAWGYLFLHEAVSSTMVASVAVILTGAVLASGMLPRPALLPR